MCYKNFTDGTIWCGTPKCAFPHFMVIKVPYIVGPTSTWGGLELEDQQFKFKKKGL